MKVLLVGGGMTSALTGTIIRNCFPDFKITMWDKARGAGGRMTTSRCTINNKCTADLGAQFITTTEDFMNNNRLIYHDLLSEGIIEPLNCNVIAMKDQISKKNFVVPNGFGFLVKHFFEKAKLDKCNCLYHVTSINKEGHIWSVETKTGHRDDFDIVILTMPVPQIFLLEGSITKDLSSNITDKLKSVSYSCRFVLVMFFSESLREDWGAQYIYHDPIFRYVAIENVKRNRVDEPSAVVLHTTVDFGFSNIENSITDVQPLLETQAKKLFPKWPKPCSIKCHKWKYSQVVDAFEDSPGCLVVSKTPTLIIGGDGFTGSTFDNCIKSANSICLKIREIVDKK